MSSLVIFKINDKVILTESGELYISTIEKIRHDIAKKYAVSINDVEINFIEGDAIPYILDYSEYDVGEKGIHNFIKNEQVYLNAIKFNCEINLFIDIMTKCNKYTDYIDLLDQLEFVE